MTSIEWLFNELWETPKDKFTWYSILKKAKEMENVCSSQTEISDEEIDIETNKINNKFGGSYSHGFILGVKWYREQLKNK